MDVSGEGAAVLTPATLFDLSFVPYRPGPFTPYPNVPSSLPTKGPLGGGDGGGAPLL